MKKFYRHILLLSISVLAGCTTTARVDDLIVSIEQSGVKSPSSFYILKGNNTEHINNVDFKKYSQCLSQLLQSSGWKQESYADAKLFLFLEYGTDAFYKTSRRIKPAYDEDTGVTSWVHKDSQIEKMIYTRITAADADDYRKRKGRSIPWETLVRAPQSTELSEELICRMLSAGVSILE